MSQPVDPTSGTRSFSAIWALAVIVTGISTTYGLIGVVFFFDSFPAEPWSRTVPGILYLLQPFCTLFLLVLLTLNKSRFVQTQRARQLVGLVVILLVLAAAYWAHPASFHAAEFATPVIPYTQRITLCYKLNTSDEEKPVVFRVQGASGGSRSGAWDGSQYTFAEEMYEGRLAAMDRQPFIRLHGKSASDEMGRVEITLELDARKRVHFGVEGLSNIQVNRNGKLLLQPLELDQGTHKLLISGQLEEPVRIVSMKDFAEVWARPIKSSGARIADADLSEDGNFVGIATTAPGVQPLVTVVFPDGGSLEYGKGNFPLSIPTMNLKIASVPSGFRMVVDTPSEVFLVRGQRVKEKADIRGVAVGGVKVNPHCFTAAEDVSFAWVQHERKAIARLGLTFRDITSTKSTGKVNVTIADDLMVDYISCDQLGCHLAVASRSGELAYLDHRSVRWRARLHLPIHQVVISPDGTWIAVRDQMRTVSCFGSDGKQLWSKNLEAGGDIVAAKDSTCVFVSQSKLSGSMTVLPNRDVKNTPLKPTTSIFCITKDGEQLWQKTFNEAFTKLVGLNSRFLVAGTDDGRLLVVGSDGEVAQAVKLSTARTREAALLAGQFVTHLDISADGRSLLTVTGDGKVSLFRRALSASSEGLSREASRHIDRGYALVGHNKGVTSLAFSNDGSTLASGSWDGTMCVWDVSTKKLMRRLQINRFGSLSVAFSPNGRTIATGDYDGIVKLWDVRNGKLQRTLKAHKVTVESVAFSPDGNTLATASPYPDCTVKIWNAQSGESVRTLSAQNEDFKSLAYSPDGKVLVTGAGGMKEGRLSGAVKLWNVETGALVLAKTDFTGMVRAVAFSPLNHNIIACASEHDSVTLWDFQENAVLRVHKVLLPTSVAFSPDGKMLAGGGSDLGFSPQSGIVNLWDVPSGLLRSTFGVGVVSGTAVAFTPDGKSLAAGCHDGPIWLFDLRKERSHP